MQDTVDQAHGALPRTLAGIIEDARRAVCGHCCAGSPAGACSFSGTGPEGLQLARFARARLRGLISEADLPAALAPAGDVFTDATVIYGSARLGAGQRVTLAREYLTGAQLPAERSGATSCDRLRAPGEGQIRNRHLDSGREAALANQARGGIAGSLPEVKSGTQGAGGSTGPRISSLIRRLPRPGHIRGPGRRPLPVRPEMAHVSFALMDLFLRAVIQLASFHGTCSRS